MVEDANWDYDAQNVHMYVYCMCVSLSISFYVCLGVQELWISW
jgi:hypothetical protein